MGNIYSKVYFKCPRCGSLKYKKYGKPQQKIYKCTDCGTLRNKGKEVRKDGI